MIKSRDGKHEYEVMKHMYTYGHVIDTRIIYDCSLVDTEKQIYNT